MELTGIEIIFGIAANGIRFYAHKRYIDFFMPKDTCRWKNMWWLYGIASIATFYISAAFANPAWNLLANVLALLLVLPVISIVCIHVTIALINYQRESSLIIALGFLVTNVLVFSIYCSLQKFHSASMNEKRLEQMNNIYKYQLKVMRESNNQKEKLRHDLKHHILELSAMVKNDSCTDIEQYLSRMERFMLNPDEKVQTGNEELDGVLNYLLRQANETLKKVEIDIKILESMYSGNFDICAVMGNLVENTIRGAGKSEENIYLLQCTCR